MDFIGNLEAKIVGIQGFEKWKNLENWEIVEILNKLEINVKKYLSFTEKTIFINDVMNASVFEKKNGIKYLDFGFKKITIDVYVMKEYAGIEFKEEELINQYDFLKEKGIVDMIYRLIPEDEINELMDLVEKTCEQEIKISNTVENILSDTVYKITQAIPESSQIEKWIKSVVKSLKNFDPAKYKKLNEMMDFAKGETEEKPKKKTTKKKTTKADTPIDIIKE